MILDKGICKVVNVQYFNVRGKHDKKESKTNRSGSWQTKCW